jgi:hypothetical protein
MQIFKSAQLNRQPVMNVSINRKGRKVLRKGRNVFIYCQNFAFFCGKCFLILLYLMNFASLNRLIIFYG